MPTKKRTTSSKKSSKKINRAAKQARRSKKKKTNRTRRLRANVATRPVIRKTSTKVKVKRTTRRTKKGVRAVRGKKRSTVNRVMRQAKRGELKSGRSGKKVTNPKQAIAIALSEARRAGEQVSPPNKRRPAR